MPIARVLPGVVLAAVLACNAPRAPNEAAGGQAGAGELSCDERLRAQGVCLRAMADRCRTEAQDCESSCEDRNQMTANSQKVPSNRDELEAPRCRDACRVNAEACTRQTQAQCPGPCEPDAAAPSPAPASEPAPGSSPTPTTTL